MATGMHLPELNLVLLSGRLTRDPDNRMTQKGQAVCGFDIAVNRRYLDNASGEWKDDVAYVPVSLFGPAAQRSQDKLKKGVPVVVEGRLVLNEYTDKAGQTRRVLRVSARRVQILQSGDGLMSEEDTAAEIPSDATEDDVPF